ncbi:hypothetical protein M8C13_01770 [Crossiella sp. SN42]|nr:hypothetical protein [Crossiella sp. SN42]
MHRDGVVHGDVKPENVLFAHEDGWRTVLADLETLAETGGPTSWRLTEGYAAPEQIAGAPADPAMDVWAWGRTLSDGPIGWDWLTKLVERSLSEDPSARPDTAEIIDCCGQHLGFGDEHTSFLGADPGLTRYPLAALLPQLDSWPRRGDVAEVRLSLGWAAWLPECHQLYQLHTVPALLRIEELSGRALADPALPGGIAPSFHCLRVKALAELLEITGEPADAERLRAAALAWEHLGAFEPELDTALLAQSWLMLDDPPARAAVCPAVLRRGPGKPLRAGRDAVVLPSQRRAGDGGHGGGAAGAHRGSRDDPALAAAPGDRPAGRRAVRGAGPAAGRARWAAH